MRVELRVHGQTAIREVDADTISGVLSELGLTSQECIVLVNGLPVPENRPLKESDRVMVLGVVSGG